MRYGLLLLLEKQEDRAGQWISTIEHLFILLYDRSNSSSSLKEARKQLCASVLKNAKTVKANIRLYFAFTIQLNTHKNRAVEALVSQAKSDKLSLQWSE